MEYQATYFLPLSLSFAYVKSMRDCILVPARRTRSCCPAMHPASSLPAYRRRHAGFAGACLRPTTWAPQHRGRITSVCGHYYVGVWPLPFRAMVESVFCGTLGTPDPFDLRARAAVAFFGVAFGVARLISPRLASTGATAESCRIFLDDSTVAR